MNCIVYPAVLEIDPNDQMCYFNFQDLNIVSIGVSVEEAYLRACADFQAYISFAEKFDVPISEPSHFIDFEKLNPKKRVMLFRANVSGEKVKLSNDEEAYKRLVQGMIE